MGIITNVRNRLAKSLQVQQSPKIFRAGTRALSRQQITMVEFFKNWSGACVNKRAEKVGGIDNFITDVNGDAVQDNWVSELIDRPNQIFNYTFGDIKELLQRWIDYTGNGILWTPLNGQKYPTQMWVMPSDSRMQILMDGGDIQEYRILTNDGYMKLDKDEVCHIKTLKPSADWQKNFYIGSPIAFETAIDSIETDLEIKEFLRDSFKADTIAPLVLSNPSEFESQEQILQIKDRIKNESLNRKIAVALENDMKLLPIPTTGIGSQAIADTLKKQTNAILISAAFGVPFGMLDTTSQQNVATAQENKNTFLLDTVEPLLKRIETTVSNHLSKFERVYKLQHKPFEIKDIETEMSKTKLQLDYGIVTRNEVRISEGLEPIAGGDEPLVPNNLTTWQNINTSVEKSEGGKVEKKKSIGSYEALTEAERIKLWKEIDDTVKPYEEEIFTGVSKTILQMGEELISHFKESKGIKSPSETILATFDDFGFDKFVEVIEKNAEKGVGGLIATMVEKTNRTYQGGTTNYAGQIIEATKKSVNKITPSIDVIRAGLRNDLQTYILANPYATSDELYSGIIDNFEKEFYGTGTTEGLGKARAAMIAQTSATYSATSGQIIVFNELGLQKVWMTQRDTKVRSTHRQADGQMADKQGNFYIGTDVMKQPAGGNEAKENVHCRCYLFAQRKD